MIQHQATLINKLGLHARAAMQLVNLATRFQCKITIQYNNRDVNAKSIMNMMVLGATCGSQLTFSLQGPDENDAWKAISELINNRFGEAE